MGINIYSGNMADALFSKVQQRVLGLLYGQHLRSFYVNEITRLAESGTGAVQRELERLTSAGLLTVKTIGNQKHYQANPAAPIFEELKSLVTKTFGAGDLLRHALLPFSNKIDLAFIYGSLAKGKDTAKSDIDIMIIGENLSYPDFYEAFTIAESQLGRTINPTIYSMKELETKIAKKNTFISRVIAQPKIFLIGSENELPSK